MSEPKYALYTYNIQGLTLIGRYRSFDSLVLALIPALHEYGTVIVEVKKHETSNK